MCGGGGGGGAGEGGKSRTFTSGSKIIRPPHPRPSLLPSLDRGVEKGKLKRVHIMLPYLFIYLSAFCSFIYMCYLSSKTSSVCVCVG